ncbi:hypothetical protein JCM10212_005517 [Sporobolomyces blumeae]
MAGQPKSILKKRARSPAVAPRAEEAPTTKGAVPSQEPVHVPSSEGEDESEDEALEDGEDDFSAGSQDEDEDEDDEDAIRDMLEDGQERPAKKLKHTTLRPTTADAFSSSLQHLLSLPSTSSNPVPVRPPPSAATLRLERRARSVIRETKAQHLSRGHVRDVIGGWAARPPLPFSQWESQQARDFEAARRGGSLDDGVETGAEREKRLRKLAQRGVVRLFNAIGAAQGVTGKDKELEEQEARKKAAVKLGAEQIASGGTVNRRPNVLGGRGKGEALTNLSKASFLDLIRAGTSTGPATPAVK